MAVNMQYGDPIQGLTREQLAQKAQALTAPTTPKPVGVQAISPTSNIKPPTNTLPSSQISTTTNAVPANLPAPTREGGPSLTPANSGYGTPAPAAPYTPPNQGTTGVSQGGIIGNLTNLGNQDSADVVKARQDLQNLQNEYAKQDANVQQNSGDLSLATGREGILNRLFASKLAAAQTGVQNALTAQGQRIGATSSAGQLNAPIVNPQTQGLVNPSANSTTGGTTSGAPLASLVGSRSNMDVYGIGSRVGADGHTVEYFDKATNQGFPTPQALAQFINSKNPSVGATPANVFDILKNQEFYNKSTNQGFTNPQQLADFVNQQNGNNLANATNVFDQLNQGQSADPVKPNDPYYQTLATAANLLATNQVDAANALMGSMPAAVKAQVIRMAQSQGYNSNVAAGLASAQQSNTANAGTAATEAARQAYINSYPAVLQLNQALNNVADAGNLTLQNAEGQNVNPFTFVPANTLIRDARSLFSSSGQAVFDSNIINLRNLVQNLNASGGGNIPSVITENAQGLIDGSISMATLKNLITAAKQEGALRLANAQSTAAAAYDQTQQSAGSTSSGSTGSTSGGLNVGGYTFHQNAQGQWVAN